MPGAGRGPGPPDSAAGRAASTGGAGRSRRLPAGRAPGAVTGLLCGAGGGRFLRRPLGAGEPRSRPDPRSPPLPPPCGRPTPSRATRRGSGRAPGRPLGSDRGGEGVSAGPGPGPGGPGAGGSLPLVARTPPPGSRGGHRAAEPAAPVPSRPAVPQPRPGPGGAGLRAAGLGSRAWPSPGRAASGAAPGRRPGGSGRDGRRRGEPGTAAAARFGPRSPGRVGAAARVAPGAVGGRCLRGAARDGASPRAPGWDHFVVPRDAVGSGSSAPVRSGKGSSHRCLKEKKEKKKSNPCGRVSFSDCKVPMLKLYFIKKALKLYPTNKFRSKRKPNAQT